MQLIHLECATQWILVYSRIYATIATAYFKVFSSSQKKPASFGHHSSTHFSYLFYN